MMKFTDYEATDVQPLGANSPLIGWMHYFLSVRRLSYGLEVAEVGAANLQSHE